MKWKTEMGSPKGDGRGKEGKKEGRRDRERERTYTNIPLGEWAYFGKVRKVWVAISVATCMKKRFFRQSKCI